MLPVLQTIHFVMEAPPSLEAFYASVLSQSNEIIFTATQSTSNVLLPADNDYAAPFTPMRASRT